MSAPDRRYAPNGADLTGDPPASHSIPSGSEVQFDDPCPACGNIVTWLHRREYGEQPAHYLIPCPTCDGGEAA